MFVTFMRYLYQAYYYVDNLKKTFMVDALKKPVFLKVLLGSIILIYIFSLVGRSPNVDDAWLGEHAYWLAKTGHVKSGLMRGVTSQEEKLVVYHKLHTIIGAIFIKMFGFWLYVLKSINLIFLILFLILFYKYFKWKQLSANSFSFALILLFFNFAFFKHTFDYRPEIPAMTMGFISFIFLEKFFRNTIEIKFYMLAGAFAGLASLMHLNGLIFIFAGCLLLFTNKYIVQGIFFGISSIPVLLLYFYDMNSHADFQLWITQYYLPHFDARKGGGFFTIYFSRIVDEHMRYFHSPKEISLTILIIISLLFSRIALKKCRHTFHYMILLAIGLSFLSVHKTSYYLLLLMPYFVILISVSLDDILINNNNILLFGHSYSAKIQQNVMVAVFTIYLMVQLIYVIPFSFIKNELNGYHKIITEKITEQTDSLQIIAPMTFVFNEIEHFKTIQGEICYNELKKSDPSIFGTGFLNKAAEFDIDYIILSEFFITHFGVDQLNEDDILAANYELIYKSSTMVILKNCR